jgi:hypothetical protein
MTLRQKQSCFAYHVGRLILKAYGMGFEVTLGEALRTAEQAARNARRGTGISQSLHTQKLAIDLNLFKDGKYLSSTEAHRRLGEWWEKQHELARWGGRFHDGNHYSFAHGGRA